MSSRLVDLSAAILEDHFGFYVSSVGNFLMREQLPLMLLAKKLAPLKITSRELKNSLAILDQHNLLHFEQGPRSILYSVRPQLVLQLIRAPRAILVIKTLYEGVAEAIFEDVLAQGRTSCSDCIRRVSKCLDNLPFDKVKHDFVRLAEAQILMRCERFIREEQDGIPETLAAAIPMLEPEPDPFLMPDVILDSKSSSNSQSKNGQNEEEQEAGTSTIMAVATEGEGNESTSTANGTTIPTSSRKRKHPQEEATAADSDTQILWRINWARMERFFRDDLVLDSMGGNELLDKPALLVAQLLLKVGEVRSPLLAGQSSPISLQDICRYVREHQLDYSRELIDEKLTIIGRDTAGIVRRVGDSAGGLYIINYEKGIESLCLEHIESAIREKIGDKAVRIFRLLRSKGFMEEEQVEKEAMLAAKETKEMCCTLMDNSFISTRQIARANDFAPARTIFLYSVNISNVLSSMLHFLTGAIRNVIRRRMLEREKHEPLLDRQLKMEVIISSITNNPNFAGEDEEARKEQIAEVEQAYMTAEDRSHLERFRKAERRLWSMEIQLERIHFALQQFQHLRQRENAEQQRQTALKGRRRRTQQQQIIQQL